MRRHNFCTLFDSLYLSRGLVMYNSLAAATGTEFHLYVYAFDNLCFDILQNMFLPNMTVVPMSQFENERLLAVKPFRTRGEYCWTCTSHIIGHALESFGLEEVTYLDADLCFYHNPGILLDEFRSADASVLITPHRYTPCYDISGQKGIYCVQFMTFRADHRGIRALTWWQDRCLEWCYDRNENGLFGDQKYLDDWTDRFPGVHVLTHIGGGVAPWNVQQYDVRSVDNCLRVNDTPVVFYHFHAYKYYQDGFHNLGNYRLDQPIIELLYHPYIHAVQSAESVLLHDFGIAPGVTQRDTSLRAYLGRLLRKLKGEDNVVRTV